MELPVGYLKKALEWFILKSLSKLGSSSSPYTTKKHLSFFHGSLGGELHRPAINHSSTPICLLQRLDLKNQRKRVKIGGFLTFFDQHLLIRLMEEIWRENQLRFLVEIPFFMTILYMQTVVGFGISEPSTVVYGKFPLIDNTFLGSSLIPPKWLAFTLFNRRFIFIHGCFFLHCYLSFRGCI